MAYHWFAACFHRCPANQWIHNNVSLRTRIRERDRSINQITDLLCARSPQVGMDCRKPVKEAREEQREGWESRENERHAEGYSNFQPSLARKFSMCDNLSSGPAEVSDRTMQEGREGERERERERERETTCMHNLCGRFLRKETGPKAEKGWSGFRQERNAVSFHLPSS